MKRKIALLLCLLLLSACGAPPPDAAIDGSAGRQLPREAESICCISPFAGPLIVMFGKGDRLTSACNNVTRSVLLNEICPGTADVPVAKGSGSVNAETILENKTDLLFVDDGTWSNEDERAKLEELEKLGIPCVVIGCETLEEQMEAIRTVGAALGAEDEAAEYTAWYRDTLDRVAEACLETEKPRIYHAVNEAVRTDWPGSICAQWIALAGAENVSADGRALDLKGDKAYTTLEQIYVWNPDLIICNEPGVDGYILGDEKWKGLECVREGRVYQIPVGVSRMGHPTSTETPLALLWLAGLLHPDTFELDFRKEVRDYYARFYDYEMSEEMVTAVIEGDDMRKARTNSPVE